MSLLSKIPIPISIGGNSLNVPELLDSGSRQRQCLAVLLRNSAQAQR